VQADGNMLTDKVMDLAITYNGNDIKGVNHLLKVFSFAHHIGVAENCDTRLQSIIDISALLHDTGIYESGRKYNSAEGKWFEQETERPEYGKIIKEEIFKTKSGIRLLEQLYT
jgi:HD superfamily phosphodiesterase